MSFFQKYRGFLITAAVSLLGFFPLMGAPGFGLMSAFQGIRAVTTGAAYDVHYGDSAWPMAIMYAIVAPWIVYLVFLALGRLSTPLSLKTGKTRLLTAAFVSFAGLFVFHILFCLPAGA